MWVCRVLEIAIDFGGWVEAGGEAAGAGAGIGVQHARPHPAVTNWSPDSPLPGVEGAGDLE